MDSPVVFGHLSGASRARAEHLIQLKEEVEAQVARYPERVTFDRDISTTMIYVHHVPRHDAADRLGALVAAASTEAPSVLCDNGVTQ